jgi:hypothetical protein
MRGFVSIIALLLLAACAEAPQQTLHTLRPSVPWPDAKPVAPAAVNGAPAAEPGRSIDATPISSYSPATDAQIQAILVARSLASFHGDCPCPYSVGRDGQRCGERSVYSRSTSSPLLCHPHDVTPKMIADHRARSR